MANWLSFGAPCRTVWGSITRGAECAEENRRDEVYNEYKSYEDFLFQRSLDERDLLFSQSRELLQALGLFVLVAAFIFFYFRD